MPSRCRELRARWVVHSHIQLPLYVCLLLFHPNHKRKIHRYRIWLFPNIWAQSGSMQLSLLLFNGSFVRQGTYLPIYVGTGFQFGCATCILNGVVAVEMCSLSCRRYLSMAAQTTSLQYFKFSLVFHFDWRSPYCHLRILFEHIFYALFISFIDVMLSVFNR